MSARRRLAVTGIAAATAAAALHRVALADAAAVAADPYGAELAPLPPGEVRTVTSADGTTLHVEVRGPDTAPTVVLVHGWTCAGPFWTPQLRALDGEYRLVTYDQRGHGASALPKADGFTPLALAEDLSAVLDEVLVPGQQAVLVGHSMGAMSIVAWAGEYPEQVSARAAAVLLCSTGVDDLVLESLLLPLPDRFTGVRTAVVGALLTSRAPMGPPSPLSNRITRYIALSAQATPAQVAFCERLTLSCPARGRHGWAVAMGSFRLRPSLAHLDVPTSVLVGSADRLTPPVHAHRLAADLPRLEDEIELPGVGHMTPIEAADRVSAEIRALVDRHLATAAQRASKPASTNTPSTSLGSRDR